MVDVFTRPTADTIVDQNVNFGGGVNGCGEVAWPTNGDILLIQVAVANYSTWSQPFNMCLSLFSLTSGGTNGGTIASSTVTNNTTTGDSIPANKWIMQQPPYTDGFDQRVYVWGVDLLRLARWAMGPGGVRIGVDFTRNGAIHDHAALCGAYRYSNAGTLVSTVCDYTGAYRGLGARDGSVCVFSPGGGWGGSDRVIRVDFTTAGSFANCSQSP